MSDSIKIVFTGTGSGKSSLNRFHSSFLIRSDSYNLQIDAGDGISRALLRLGIGFNEIDGILITHFHPDHFSGLITLIQQMKLIKRQMPLDLFVSKGSINFIRELLMRSFLLEERLPFQLNLKRIETGKKTDFRGKFTITAIENSHLEEYRELGVKGLDLKSFSIAVTSGTGELYYSGDVGTSMDLAGLKFGNGAILVTETTHVTVEDIIGIIESNDLKKVILTHIDADDPSALITKITNLYPDGLNKFTVAHDGLMITV